MRPNRLRSGCREGQTLPRFSAVFGYNALLVRRSPDGTHAPMAPLEFTFATNDPGLRLRDALRLYSGGAGSVAPLIPRGIVHDISRIFLRLPSTP